LVSAELQVVGIFPMDKYSLQYTVTELRFIILYDIFVYHAMLQQNTQYSNT